MKCNARIGVLLVLSSAALGCGESHGALRNPDPIFLEARADTGVALRAAMLRDTVAPSGRGAVEVFYAIVNGPSPSRFDNHPGRYRIVVTGPDGQPAASLGGSGPAVGASGPYEVVLPAGGTLVQRQDLRCVHDGAYHTLPIPPTADDCLAMYALTIPGSYRVIVDYFGPEAESATVAGNRAMSAVGVHLADTLTFIVAGK